MTVVTSKQGEEVTRMREGRHSEAGDKQVQRTATETHALTPEIPRSPSKTQ